MLGVLSRLCKQQRGLLRSYSWIKFLMLSKTDISYYIVRGNCIRWFLDKNMNLETQSVVKGKKGPVIFNSGNFKLFSLDRSNNHGAIEMEMVREVLKVESCFNPSRPIPGRREKIKLHFYFHTSLWCFKRFYEGLHKTFRGTTKKYENKNLT